LSSASYIATPQSVGPFASAFERGQLRLQVDARREAAAGAGDHRGADVVGRVDAAQRVDQRAHHRHVDRVDRRTVEGDRGDRAVLFEAQAMHRGNATRDGRVLSWDIVTVRPSGRRSGGGHCRNPRCEIPVALQ